VAQLRASIATLEAQAQAREENARTRLAAVSELLTISTARVSTLEGDLRAANSLLETSMTRVTRLEAGLESTKKLLEAAHAEGKLASEPQLKLAVQAKTDAKGLHQTAERMAQALAEFWTVRYHRSLSGMRTH
jgi:chromosome segregation ATPase